MNLTSTTTVAQQHRNDMVAAATRRNLIRIARAARKAGTANS